MPTWLSSSSDVLASSSLSSSSENSALSKPLLRITKEATHPRSAMPANKPHARASPLGLTRVDKVNRPPDKNGPMLRPAAERVWAIPLSVPRVSCEGAELVILNLISNETRRGAEGSCQHSPEA